MTLNIIYTGNFEEKFVFKSRVSQIDNFYFLNTFIFNDLTGAENISGQLHLIWLWNRLNAISARGDIMWKCFLCLFRVTYYEYSYTCKLSEVFRQTGESCLSHHSITQSLHPTQQKHHRILNAKITKHTGTKISTVPKFVVETHVALRFFFGGVFENGVITDSFLKNCFPVLEPQQQYRMSTISKVNNIESQQHRNPQLYITIA